MAHRTRPSALALSLPLLAVLAGCGGTVVEPAPTPPVSEGFEKTLTKNGGCGDVFLYAANATNTVALFAQTTKFITVGAPHSSVFPLPSVGLKLQVQVGGDLTSDACNDVVMSSPRRDFIYEPTSGTATLTATPATGGAPSGMTTATLRLENVVFRSERGDLLTLPLFEISGVNVGWYPG
jgi:hypothetical protein